MNQLTERERYHWEFTSRQRLWQAVLWQQMMDAESNINLPPAKLRKAQARDYLTSNRRDFRLVCGYAGFDPDIILAGCKKRFSDPPISQADLPFSKTYVPQPIQDFLFDVQPFTLTHCRTKRHAKRFAQRTMWVQESLW